MIVDKIDNIDRYESLHPRFKQAFKFLKNLPNLVPGRIDIDGDFLFANYIDDSLKEDANLEFHKKYIDIQMTIEGHDRIGWKSISDCSDLKQEYSKEVDVGFFQDNKTAFFDMPKNHFALLFPKDAHAPMLGKGNIKKIVVKVLLD